MPKKMSTSYGSMFAVGFLHICSGLGLQSRPLVLTILMAEFSLRCRCMILNFVRLWLTGLVIYCAHVDLRAGTGSPFLPLHWFWGLNSAHRAWQLAPLPTELSHWPVTAGFFVCRWDVHSGWRLLSSHYYSSLDCHWPGHCPGWLRIHIGFSSPVRLPRKHTAFCRLWEKQYGHKHR